LPGSELLAPLERIMREAGEIARATARTSFKRWTKGHDNSPVSEGDIAVNDFLRTQLGALAADAAWLSEETEAPPDRSVPFAWIVDPIDGTRAYISGKPDWTVAVALVEDGVPQLAALYAPVTEEMFLAARGQGTTLNGARILANAGASLSGAKVAGPKRYLERLVHLNPQIAAQPKIHSLALRLARVAQGHLDAAFASGGGHDWDLAAADLLVHEAGGVVTDLAGRGLVYNRPPFSHGALIAAGREHHAALIDLVRNRTAEFA